MKRRKRYRKRHRQAAGEKDFKSSRCSRHHPNWLVGFTGIVQRKKLWPLRRSRTDNKWESKIKQEYEEKCNRLERHLKCHQNLLEQLGNVVKDDASQELERELTEMLRNNGKILCFIAKEDPQCSLPSSLQDVLAEIERKDVNLASELKRHFTCNGSDHKQQPDFPSSRRTDTTMNKTIETTEETGNSAKRTTDVCKTECTEDLTVKEKDISRNNVYQLFVLNFQAPGIVVLDCLQPSDTGETLVRVVNEKIGHLPSGCEFMSGNKKLKRNQTLEKQGIENESNITVCLKLLGGMDPNSAKAGEQTMKRQSESVLEELPAEYCSTGMNTGEEECKDDEGELACNPLPRESSSENKHNGIKEPFGVIATFEEFDEALSIINFSTEPPRTGDVVTVRGFCSSTPNNRGGAGSVLLRNDPPDGTSFLQLKVDIRANPASTVLTKYIVSDVLNLQLGGELAIRGRVEPLDEGFTSKRQGFEILPFKVVVDSDGHAAARKGIETIKPRLFRQFSTPWPLAYGLFPAEFDSQPLWLGNKLQADKGAVWLPPETNQMKIKLKEYAIAARNCRTTDIFVGVKEDGKVVGLEMQKQNLVREREDLCKVVSAILPTLDCTFCVCEKAAEAANLVAKGKSFVAFMWLQNPEESYTETFNEDNLTVLIRVHVTKGIKPVYFAKQTDTNAFVRVGAVTKKVSDYEDLFHRLESLAWRNIPDTTEADIHQEIEKASTFQKCADKYQLFKALRFETDKREFKVIFGDPKDVILKDYIAEYTAAFLSTEGGDVYFGVEEDEKTKLGHVVGVILSAEDRKALLRESARTVCNFWPPVHSSQFLITFVDVECKEGLAKYALEFPKTSLKGKGKYILLSVEPKANVQKLNKIVKSKQQSRKGKLALLRVGASCYCIISEDPKTINTEQLLQSLEEDLKNLPNVQLDELAETELKKLSRDLCVVHLHVKQSPFPIHLCKPLYSFSFGPSGELRPMEPPELLERFKTSKNEFNVDKFLRAVNRFDRCSNSFVLMAAPFKFENGPDLYGLVIPEWLLVLDFDQHPNEDGHLLNVFKDQHDLHQGERNLFVKTPFDRKLDINPDNGTCWCAVRGYQELAHTLSDETHGEWNISHGHKIRTHLNDQLVMQVNPNHLVVLCLWNEDHESLLPSMQLLLEHTFSIWSRTSIVFVCPNRRAEKAMMEKLVEPLHSTYGNRIKKDNVFVVPPQHLARYLAVKLPAPYCPENAFQIPKQLRLYNGDRIIPETLPQNIRQAVHGHLQIVYLAAGETATPEEVEKAREHFYSGSEISLVGLANGIGIRREKMKDLKQELKALLKDKKSHVCMIVLKAQRGSGSSTLCLQFLYENHTSYPCAQLVEFHDSLVTNIEKINQHTKLPLLLFVDSEMANLQDFTDFKNDAERRNVHVVLIVVESEVFYRSKPAKSKQSQKRGRSKLAATPYSAGAAPYKIVELSREIERSEIPILVNQLRQIKNLPEDKERHLEDLQKKAEPESSLRTFAHFSLTVFGRKFTGLRDYVSYRLSKTNDTEAEILEFLALIHVYTDHLFPVNAFARMLQTKVVFLENVFTNGDVTELLSPPIRGKGHRRISFGEVAEEILQQQAAKKKLEFASFLGDLALRMAQKVLAVREPSKKLDRITRRLFVTSEYESRKFSSLVRTLKDESKDVARDTMKGLVKIYEEGTSVWAHLLAHLAKFHMIEYGDFKEALLCIEAALKEQPDDVLLHHIHGDIIRLHIQNLKEKEDLDPDEVLKHAIVSSSCFQKVREKRPLMEYGYTSDALVRRIVMQAVVKTLGADSHFTDYLNKILQEMGENETRDPLHVEEKFILALIPDAFGFLQDVQISEHTDQMKKSLLSLMGDLDDVKAFCEELKKQMKDSSDSGWINEVARRTTTLVYTLEMETRSLTPEEADERIAYLEEHTNARHDEHSMKLWTRFIRFASSVPPLKTVQKKIEAWMSTTKGSSLHANFYCYVIAVLVALNDPKDKEKMERACKAIDEMQRKRHVRRLRSASEAHSLPLEWLSPKQGRHINSIDSLLHHDEMVKEYLNVTNSSNTQNRVGREIIERALFERNITKWEGKVGDIESDWKGKIYMKGHIPVHFVPSNVTPSMPSSGDDVRFCLSFGWSGLRAWAVVCPPGMDKTRKAENNRPAKELYTEDKSSGPGSSEEENSGDDILVPKPLFRENVPRQIQSDWDKHVGEELQGVVSFTKESGFGMIINPVMKEKLFFHASQIVPPVSSIKQLPNNTVVSYTVGKYEKGVRAMNVRVVKDDGDYLPEIKEYLANFDDEDERAGLSPPRKAEKQSRVLKDSHQSGRQEGIVVRLLPSSEKATHGFIEVTGRPKNLFFHERESEIGAVDMKRIAVGTKVQFSIDKNNRGDNYIAKDVYIQSEVRRSCCSCGWEPFVGRGIQEGYINVLNGKGFGFIAKDGLPGRGVYFHQSDMKGAFPWSQLRRGTYVHFKVAENAKSCIAKEVCVVSTQPVPTPQRPVVNLAQAQGFLPPYQPPMLPLRGPLMRADPQEDAYSRASSGEWQVYQGRRNTRR